MLTMSGYQINKPIYESAHSVIYRGRREMDDQPVIFKVLKGEYPIPEELARFRREYEITRSLMEIDGIIQVYGLEPYKNSLLMMVEDFGGESLTRLLPDRTLELSEFLQLAIRITDILGVIHQRHIMHKDINPSNIVWNPETDQLKIIDFGISTELSREQVEIRNPNVLEGTLAYMSPEQTGRMNRAMDYRTDLYSLGITFYEILTGQLPFQAEDAMELVHCHIAKMPVPPCDLPGSTGVLPAPGSADILSASDAGETPALPGEEPKILSDIIMKLLAKNAEDRYQSAFGLKADLQTCLDQLTATNTIEPFTIAQQDISERFQIPQKLYGREQEIDILLTAFDRVSGTQKPGFSEKPGFSTELLLVTGYAGIGKSALVHEVHKPITEKRGYFISGKFDQFKRNIPYSALIQVFQGFMRQLLTEPEEQLALWKEKFLKAVGPNGQVIIDVIPDVELIVGEQPDVPELPPNQAQNRFNFVFQNFVRTCASAEHPLVIFLDDLQWVDWASLNLLELFMTDARTQFMLIVGAYRDNEVSDAHPLMLTLNDIQKAEAAVNTVTLIPLKLEHVNQLLADTLHVQTEVCTPFGELLLQKTGGNPFFLRQFLQTLYEDELLEFDSKRSVWAWNLDEIQKREMTDNVVELMADKIQKLPEVTQDVLKLAACIGNQFDLHTLSIVYEQSPVGTMHDLQEALQEELIIPLDESYKYVGIDVGNSESASRLSTFDFQLPTFRFLHDRVQQAAYSLIEEEHKHDVHLKIGRLLLSNTSEEEREEHIFDIVNHLNLGKDLVTEQAEKDELANLNLMAGRKAKASAAYHAAFAYLQAGLSLLNAESWQQQYAMTLAFYEETTEAAYLSRDFETMERLIEIVLNRAKTILDQVKVYKVKILAYQAQNMLPEALQTGLHALTLLGVHFPAHPTRLHILPALLHTKWVLARTPIEEFINLPDMTDPYALAVRSIRHTIVAIAHSTVPNLLPLTTFKALNLTVRHGKTPSSAVTIAGYGLILCGVLGDIESGYRCGQLALRMLERSHTRAMKPKVLFLVATFIRHWKERVRDVLPLLLEGYQAGLETGDLEYASYAIGLYLMQSPFIGNELGDLEHQLAQVRQTLVQLKQEREVHVIEMVRQMVVNLISDVDDPCRLIGESYDEAQMRPLHVEANDRLALFTVSFLKLFLCSLFHEYVQAVEHATEAETYLDGVRAMSFVPLFRFYDSLARLAVCPDASKSEQRRILKKVAANQKKMKKWAQHAPMNYLHKWFLVEAERAQVLGKDVEAMASYDQAIAGARVHEYLNEEALANEVAAKFYLARGRKAIACTYMQEARYCYLKWGANAKVRHLNETYPQLLTSTQEGRDRTGTVSKTSTSTTTNAGVLDVSSLMKASQTISGEIVLSELLKKMMRIVIENAGAQQGFLMLEKHDTWSIEAEGTVESPEVKLLHSLPVESRISAAIVQYVARTKEPVVLNDATREGQFTRDSYILKHHPKSVLCLPLVNQGKLTGILYVENNLTTGAFTPDRVDVLNVLSSQMAIAIENATLYKHAEDTLNRQVELTRSYSRFVPYEYLRFLQKETILDVNLGDHISKEMAVMFSDIRSFTALSEAMTPQENFDFINAYFKRVSPVIRAHDGFIVKFLGDGMMAVFPNSSEDAVRASIEQLNTVVQYNLHRQQEGWQPIQVGIGIHVGHMMVGMVGEAARMQGDAFSDNVNLTSRLEGLTKYYGVSLIVSDDTIQRLRDPDRYHLRFLGKVQLKGKEETISAYEIYDGDPEEMIALKLKTKSDFEEGLNLYYAKEFAEAAVCFKQVLKTNPDDKTAKLYLERSAQFMVHGVSDDWDGIEALEHK